MIKIIRTVLTTAIVLFLLWVNIPSTIPYQFKIANREFKGEIKRPVISGREFELKLGLDLKGGSSLIFDVDTSKVTKENLEVALESARDIVERRVNFFGISEPSVRTIKSGDKYRIAVDLPGIQNVSEAVDLIGSTAQLSFKEEASAPAAIATTTPIFLRLTKETGLTGQDVKKASVTFNQENGQPQVLLEFSERGTTLFADISTRNVGKAVAIYLDQDILSAPIVQTPILDGNAVINGDFDTEGAKQLAIAVNSGALPLPIALVEQRNIGPSLGAIEVQKSLVAGTTGLLMVMIFMVAYYGRLGIIACVGLIIYGLLSLTIFRAIPIVLTLPGIAGFILSIGMAVDANILIFERIKEELRKGRELPQAVRLGFGRAMDAIKDANTTTLLVAFILFNPLNWEFLPQFGLVRGFALTLAIGVIMSLFTGIVVTRKLIQMFYKA
jgi:preprotein translocase subunit SecD